MSEQTYGKYDETLEHSGMAHWRSEMGRSQVQIFCPFCGDEVIAYVWSLYGSGKRCFCGALLTPTHGLRKRPTPAGEPTSDDAREGLTRGR